VRSFAAFETNKEIRGVLEGDRVVITFPIMSLGKPVAAILLLLLLLASLFLTAHRAVAQNDRENVHHYMAIADHVFSESRVDVSPEVENALGNAIEEHIGRHHKESAEEAENNVERFARALVHKAKFNEASGRRVLTIEDLRSTRNSLCPIYPVC